MNRIKMLRNQNNWTQNELGDMLKVQKAAVSKYETGAIPLTDETILRLSQIFNVSTDYLLGRDEQKEIRPSVDERILKLSDQYEEAGKLFDLFDKLSPEQQNTILSLAQVYIAQQEKDNTK